MSSVKCRLAWCALLIFMPAVWAGGDNRTAIPADTLPAQLSLDVIPMGLDPPPFPPANNILTRAKINLGRKLFFDPILSGDRTVACASCHQPAHGLAGPAAIAVGIGGRLSGRNAPSLYNRVYGTSFFWDGRETTLESQALRPIEHPSEMGAKVPEVVARLRANKEYAALFNSAFSDGVSASNLGKAIASFERVLLLGNSRVDSFRGGELQSLTADETHGLWLFESRAHCWRCHPGPTFTDEAFHNTGVNWGKAPGDLGRYVVTNLESDKGGFKTPMLRGLTLTAPYMHDGSMARLEDVVEYYNRGGSKNPNLDPAITPLGLSKTDVADLVAFLRALSDPARRSTASPKPLYSK